MGWDGMADRWHGWKEDCRWTGMVASCMSFGISGVRMWVSGTTLTWRYGRIIIGWGILGFGLGDYGLGQCIG